MINILKTSQDIITLSIDDRERDTNILSERFSTHFETLVEEITRDESIKGIILTSSKKDFLLDHDLQGLSDMESPLSIYNYILKLQRSLEMLENWGRPVVAALSGSALGAGFEIALSCHYRISINHNSIALGFSSSSSSLIPALGTIQRLSRAQGAINATNLILSEKVYNPRQAWDEGLIDAMADTSAQMQEMANAWIEQNPQPEHLWRRLEKADQLSPKSSKGKAFFREASLKLRKSTMGLSSAKNKILQRVYDGHFSDFTAACQSDAESFAELFNEVRAKNIIKSLHFASEDCRNWARVKSKDQPTLKKVGIVNPIQSTHLFTMSLIQNGINVSYFCNDITTGEAFKNSIAKLLEEKVIQLELSKESKEFQLSLIEIFDNMEYLKSCDLIVNYESTQSLELYQEIELKKKENATVLTTAHSKKLSDLTLGLTHPEQWVGIDLKNIALGQEIIELKKGAKTSGNSIKNCLKLVHDIGRIPVVINDRAYSFSHELKLAYATEALLAYSEGTHLSYIERSTHQTGMSISPFLLIDKIGLDELQTPLLEISKNEAIEHNNSYSSDSLKSLLREIESIQTNSVVNAQNFQVHNASGIGPKFNIPELSLGPDANKELNKADLADRLILAQISKALELIESKIIQSPLEADVISIMASFFPAHTGGVLSCIQYFGLETIMKKFEYLASLYGPRFKTPKILNQLNSKGIENPYELNQYFYSSRLEQED